MAPDITCLFIEVDGRLVHYAQGGAGPTVALLHESARSHAVLLPLMRRLMPRFTVLAFDTPGYGASEPLPADRSDIADFAGALAATLRALRLGPIPVYGTHTGASIAIEAANRHPEQVSRAVLDGYSIWTASEREDMLREYLPPFRPAWDGSHLAALWSRVRDAGAFFPWYRRGSSARRAGGPAPLEAHHAVLMDLLHAGDHYRAGYAASIRHDAVPAATVRPDAVQFFCRGDDLLFGHLDRLPPSANRVALGGDREAWAAAIGDSLMQGVRHGGAPVANEPARAHHVPAGGGRVLVHTLNPAGGDPVILLHGHPGSARTILPLARRLAARRAVHAVGLPLRARPPVFNEVLEALGAVLHDVPGATIVGEGTGAALALALAGRPGVAGAVLIDEPPAEILEIAPGWDGGYLQAAWHRQRDALMYSPWSDQKAEAARIMPAAPDLDALQQAATAMLHHMATDPAWTRCIRAAVPGTPRGPVVRLQSDTPLALAGAIQASTAKGTHPCA